MSFKAATTKVSDNHYVLPRTAKMKTDVHAYFSESLFLQSEESLWRQVASAASYEGVIGAYLMPDAHVGFGVPVGSVIVTDNTILQAGSGYDISCGVIYMRVPGISAADVVDLEVRERFISEVELRVATGLGSKRPRLMPKVSERKAEAILRHGARALGVRAEVCERQFIEVAEDVDLDLIDRARRKVIEQLGSVGGGNHFIEMQVDRDTGEVWVMVHCGSRGYGWQTANHFFYEGARLRGLSSNRREDSWLYADEPLGKSYWAHHNSAANYAIANRHLIASSVSDALERVFKVRGEIYYEISHNLVQAESVTLPDGTVSRGFVHRKGATRAFPAGHPELAGTKWEDTGHPCLIPGSMLDGAAILFACTDASKSGLSVNHGSGRVLARGAAKRTLEKDHDAIDAEMRHVSRSFGGVRIQGIATNTKRTPLDECGRVYKDLDSVLSVLENEGIARVAHRLYPVANIKGME